MGNDGGSIPTRRELVKEAAKDPNLSAVKEKQKEHLSHRWSQCPISHKALTKPVVADYTGDLYNKDAILQYLLPDDVSPLDKVEAEKFVQGRVKSLKDIVEVHFEIEKDDTLKTEKWTCPVTSKELGPNVKAVFIVPCGHAFSREALEVMKDVNNCPSCGSPFESRDIIPILPYTEADKNAVIERMETLKNLGLTHSLKKASGSKKRKANGNIKADGDLKPEALENGATAAGESTHANKNGNQHLRTTNTKTSSGIRNTATAGITAKVLEEEEAKKKRRLQTGENENIRSLYKKGGSKGSNGTNWFNDMVGKAFATFNPMPHTQRYSLLL